MPWLIKEGLATANKIHVVYLTSWIVDCSTSQHLATLWPFCLLEVYEKFRMAASLFGTGYNRKFKICFFLHRVSGQDS